MNMILYNIMCVKCRKGPAGAGRCEDGVCYCVKCRKGPAGAGRCEDGV